MVVAVTIVLVIVVIGSVGVGRLVAMGWVS